ncbi:hypothetical protein F4778DRAFT_781158 [Xylariomycetidae sp. FL2044]|nr:hypothetical protein F4778DRAFT_781158 [Xylariomycetidae sp. FL2044]
MADPPPAAVVPRITFDEGSRFSPTSDNDYAGYLWIITVLGLIYTTLTGIARLRIKWRVHGADDYLLIAATIGHLGQAITIFDALNSGLAKANSITLEAQWRSNGKSFAASEILAIFSLCLSKCSVVALLLRVLTTDRLRNFTMCMLAMVLCVAWGIGSVVGIGANCDMSQLLIDPDGPQCPHQAYRWRVIMATDIAIEVIILTLPIALIWSLNMTTKLKAKVALAFGSRIPLIVAAVLHFHYIEEYTSSAEPQLIVSKPLLAQQVMITWSLISATIPNVTGLLRSFSTSFSFPKGWGRPNSENSYPLESIGQRSTANSRFANSGIRGRHSSRSRDDSIFGADDVVLRSDTGENTTTIARTSDILDEDENSVGDSSVHELVISRKVQWDVRYEHRDQPP